MLRAVRFAAKLQFEIDEATRAPIASLAPLLENVPAARLFDEMLKLLMSGHALACLKRLRAEGLHHGMLPLLDVVFEQPQGERFVTLALESTDERVRARQADDAELPVRGADVARGAAAVARGTGRRRHGSRRRRRAGSIPALATAMDTVLDAQTEKLAIQRRYTADMREIWGLQPRLERRVGRAPWRLLEHPRFRAGYDFLLLRAAAGEIDPALADWWTRFIDADDAGREALQAEPSVSEAGGGSAAKRKRKRRKKPGGGAGASADGGGDERRDADGGRASSDDAKAPTRTAARTAPAASDGDDDDTSGDRDPRQSRGGDGCASRSRTRAAPTSRHRSIRRIPTTARITNERSGRLARSGRSVRRRRVHRGRRQPRLLARRGAERAGRPVRAAAHRVRRVGQPVSLGAGRRRGTRLHQHRRPGRHEAVGTRNAGSRCMPSRRATAGSARRATRRARSTSTCCCTATAS